MNDAQLTQWLRRAERDAPFPEREHERLRNEMLAHFERLRDVDETQPASRSATEQGFSVEEGDLDALERSPRWRAVPLIAAAAVVMLVAAGFALWASVGGDPQPDRLIPAESAPASPEVPSEPFGPVGATSIYDVARDGVAQGTLELRVERNDTSVASRQVTTLGVALIAPEDDRSRPQGVVSFEITEDTWSIPISLGRLSGPHWPNCGDAVVDAPRKGGETSTQTLECEGAPVSATVATERLGDELEAQIWLRTSDDEHEMSVLGGANGRLERMVIELSTTVDLIDNE